MSGGSPMSHRAEITARLESAYLRASKKDKGRILDQVVAATGWSRDNARRRLTAAKSSSDADRGLTKRPRAERAPKYSADTLTVLRQVWSASGGQCGKYLAASMRVQLDGLERHGELFFGRDGYTPVVREELLAMSAATIDRYLRPTKSNDAAGAVSVINPLAFLQSSGRLRKASGEINSAAGNFAGMLVAHCGPVRDGDFARTLKLTCVQTGWTCTRTVQTNARSHISAGLKAAIEQIPFEVVGLDFDADTELLGNLVGKGLGYRYDTPEQCAVLNRLWRLVDDRFNYLTPTKKPNGYATSRDGRRRRVYDSPKTPLDRLLAAGVLSSAQQSELTGYRDGLNPAQIAREIFDLHNSLLAMATDKPIDSSP